MPAIAIDLDEITTFGNVIDNGFFRLKLVTQLIKISHLQFGAAVNLAAVRLQLAQQELEQRALAAPVITDQANAVTTNDIERQVAYQRRAAGPGKVNVLDFDNPLTRRVSRFQLEAGFTLTLDALRTIITHRLERSYPALVTGTSSFDTLPNPHFFLSQLLIKQGVGCRFCCQLLLFMLKEAVVVTHPVDQLTTVQLHNPCSQRLQELTVVSDEKHSAAEVQQHLFQPGNGMNVQVVGWLIQQQHVRLGHQRLRQQYPATPATRQL